MSETEKDKNKKKEENIDKNSKQHIMKFLADTFNLYNSYHNHKELSAWGALVFYVLLILGIISAIEPTPLYKIGASIFLLIVGNIICYFINIQLEGRRIAANIVSRCQELTDKWLFKKNISKNDWKEPAKPIYCKYKFMAVDHLPKTIINIEIEETGKKGKFKKKLKWPLQRLFICIFEGKSKKDLEEEKKEKPPTAIEKLECIVRWLLFLAFIAALFIICHKTPEAKGILNVIQ